MAEPSAGGRFFGALLAAITNGPGLKPPCCRHHWPDDVRREVGRPIPDR